MKKCTAGDGSDSTAAVVAYLLAGNKFRFANLVLIGRPEDPAALWLTDWEGALSWPVWGTFKPTVIKCGRVESKIGLSVPDMTIEWSPIVGPVTQNINTTNYYMLAEMGFYDGWDVRNWTAFLPTPGDANTYGCCERFGGRIGPVDTEQAKITFTVNSFLDVIDTNVPKNVIELTNTLAGNQGATPPSGDASVPIFNTRPGGTETLLVLDEVSPNAGKLYADNVLRNGFVVFQSGPLAGQWSGILGNKEYAGGPYNEIVLYTPLPFPPTPGLDTCYVSSAFPVNLADGQYQGFPYVPSPTSAP